MSPELGQKALADHLLLPYTLSQLGSHVSVGSPMRGRTGLLATPGSAQVLDRGTGQLAPCTRERCPMATPVQRPDGSEVLVNKVTPVDSASWAINAFSPLARQAVAFVYLARVMGSENHKRLVLQLNGACVCVERIA